jgi:Recombinase/Transposase, Mutator family
VLAIDDASAEVVRRIFAEYLDGKGDRAIAGGLIRDGIPCPSARRSDQNPHRLADGWQASTVRVILDSPRYTGYVFFGRWTKHETLLEPDDVAAGHYQALIEAELTAVIGAAPHERSAERTAHRNGHRPRTLTTPAGDLELRIPKLRAAGGVPGRRGGHRGGRGRAPRGPRVRPAHCWPRPGFG